MSEHLPILQAMFPNQIFLDVDDIAKCLKVSKKHIYNLSSAKKLPFKLSDFSDKIQVSIIAFAKYLDSKLQQEELKKELLSVPSLVKKKGRPIGSKTKHLAFQHQLSMAIVQQEIINVFGSAVEHLEALEYKDNEFPCVDKFTSLKSEALGSLNEARSSLFASILELRLDSKPMKKKAIEI